MKIGICGITWNNTPINYIKMKRILKNNRRRILDQPDIAKAKMILLVWLLTIIAGTSMHAQPKTNDSSRHKAKTLVIASHPYPERSIVNKALHQTVENMEGVIYRNLETLYGDNISGINV